MHACIMCGQYDEALRVFETLSGGNLAISAEFQWGGQQYQVSPLCRDLAMRAMGKSQNAGKSQDAIQLFRQALADDLTISIEALQGVVGACELDLKWEEAVGVFFSFLRHLKGDTWVVPGSELRIPQIGDESVSENLVGTSISLAAEVDLLCSVMRACNASEKSGSALLCFQLFEAFLPLPLLSRQNIERIEISKEGISPIEHTLLPLILNMTPSNGELLSVTMVSLCGVGCYNEAANLFQSTKKFLSERSDGRGESDLQFWKTEQVFQYAQSHSNYSFANHHWESAHRHIHRLCRALSRLQATNKNLSAEELQVLSAGLATALRSCTLMGQPETGLLLSDQIRGEVSRLSPSNGTRGSIFGSRKEGSIESDVLMSDSLLAEKMKSLQATNQGDLALAMFEAASLSKQSSSREWPQSCNTAMSILSERDDIEEAVELFRALANSPPNVDSFVIAAQCFADRNRWSDVGDVFHLSLEKGCLSERLGMLAMKAVLEMQIPGRLRVLRDIIGEAAQAAGTSSVNWMESHYWRIKSLLGFTQARLLMWWNDPSQCHLDELRFALDVCEKRKATGLTAKKPALRLIASHASKFKDEGNIAGEMKENVSVPRTRDEWAKVVLSVIEESEGLLDNDAGFIDEVAVSLRRLGCYYECVNFVQEALSRGVRVRQVAIREALRAAESADISQEVSDIRLMLVDD